MIVKKITCSVFTILLVMSLTQCSTDSVESTVMMFPNDPFANTIAKIQTFEIDGKQDNFVEGENGTIIICPKGSFKNGKGEIVEDHIKIELAEALSFEDMLLSNLTTTSDGKLLETDGMIYFNATSNGEQLIINKDNPIHIEIPTEKKKPGMMAYKGIRDENGTMNWIEPKVIDNFLTTVDIDSLDFLPEGFQLEVDKGMPFRKYKVSTKKLTDSLYYSLSVSNGSELIKGLSSTDENEPYYRKNNGSGYDEIEETQSDSTSADCGIDPAKIKVIKSSKYQNTLISTRAFEERLKVIFQTCDNSILELYINNLNRNLYEIDSMAALVCDERKYYNSYHKFDDFSKGRLAKVKEADKYAKLLNGYYEKQLRKVKSELERHKDKVMKSLDEKNEDAQKIVKDYKELLWKREKYRMETYGFNWTETGWVNIDNGDLPKDWGSEPLEIIVENGKQFDRVYTYVIYASIESLYRLNTSDKEIFYVGNSEDKNMLMPKQQPGVAIAIGYKDEVPSIVIKVFETGTDTKFKLTLEASTIDKVRQTLKQYERYSKENVISRDLRYMARFYKEEQRQRKLKKESEFIWSLWKIAFPCCSGIDIGS